MGGRTQIAEHCGLERPGTFGLGLHKQTHQEAQEEEEGAQRFVDVRMEGSTARPIGVAASTVCR